jgi:ATP-dependent DNA helicase RecG
VGQQVSGYEFFPDRLEITSMGGLPYGVDEEDFFSGFSVPRNKEIMRVFRDLEIVEQLGSGIPRILKTYGRDAFEIRKSFVRVVFYYERPFEDSATPPSQTETRVKTRVKTSHLILETLAENPTMTLAELAERIEKSISAVERASSKLAKEGKLRYVGPQKGGHWQVQKGDHE